MKVNTDGVLLGAWSEVNQKRKILDVGTGTGLIALMLAQRNTVAEIIGLDVDINSFELARQNFRNSPFSDRLSANHVSVQDFCKLTEDRFDLIVSNPPYFTNGIFASNENRAVARHTIQLPHIELLDSVLQLLETKGHFDIILPHKEGLRFVDFAQKFGLYLQNIVNVRSKPEKPVERFLLRFGRTKENLLEDNLIIHNESDPFNYSQQFRKLTEAFYLFM
ncbi:MAG: methyltransferase [Saprospiraceae bacterium]|nr:methyltransferase [Saprospiraceae bacterium]